MSISWKCTTCGAEMTSKCPDQRSIFTKSSLDSMIVIDVIKPLKRGCGTELFINYTTGGADRTTGQIVKELMDVLTEHPSELESVGCEHQWVINSETATRCSLGCEHDNLLSAVTPIVSEKPQTLPRIMQEYREVLRTVLEQARKGVNISKPAYDVATEEDFSYLDYQIMSSLQKIGEGVHIKPKYRVGIHNKSCRGEVSFNYFHTKEEAVRYCIGTELVSLDKYVHLCKLDDTQEMYRDETFDSIIPCCICGKIKDDELILRKNGTMAHVSCARAEKRDKRSCKRMGTVKLGSMTMEKGLSIRGLIERDWELDNAYVLDAGRNKLVLRIFKVCTKPELSQIIEDIEAEFSK